MNDLVKYSEKILNISMNMVRNFGMPENCNLRWNILNGAILIIPLRKQKLRAQQVDLMCRTILLMSTKWLRLVLEQNAKSMILYFPVMPVI